MAAASPPATSSANHCSIKSNTVGDLTQRGGIGEWGASRQIGEPGWSSSRPSALATRPPRDGAIRRQADAGRVGLRSLEHALVICVRVASAVGTAPLGRIASSRDPMDGSKRRLSTRVAQALAIAIAQADPVPAPPAVALARCWTVRDQTLQPGGCRPAALANERPARARSRRPSGTGHRRGIARL